MVCFTNHALDSFLEGLLESGVTDSIIRVGGNSKSERLAAYNLSNLQEKVRALGLWETGCAWFVVRRFKIGTSFWSSFLRLIR